jgi:hypothetical protein
MMKKKRHRVQPKTHAKKKNIPSEINHSKTGNKHKRGYTQSTPCSKTKSFSAPSYTSFPSFASSLKTRQTLSIAMAQGRSHIHPKHLANSKER